jgi:protein phosphatase
VYVLNSSGITQITEDHSNIANLVKEGAITKEEARMSPIKNQVTQALGSPYGINPEYCEQPIGSGDLVLLCTDGIWDMLTDEEILSFCEKKSNMKDKCRYLIKMANKAGGEDNISVILIKVGQ